MAPASAALDRRLVEFNQLPSRTLHPSRHAVYAPPAALAAMRVPPVIEASTP